MLKLSIVSLPKISDISLVPLLRRLRAENVEVLHGEPPAGASGLDFRDGGLSPGSGGEKFPGAFEVADGGGEPDPARIHPGELRKPFNEAEGLAAAVAAHQGVNLVDDDEPQVAEQPGDIGVFVKQQRLERFRRDLKNAGGVLQKPLFAGLRDVAMPVPHRDIRLPAEVVEHSRARRLTLLLMW